MKPSPPSRRPFFATAVLVALLAACAAWKRPSASSEMRSAVLAPDPERPLRAFFTGGVAGFLTPCGCEMGQYGGLARRGAYLAAVARPDDLKIDLGNLLVPESPAHKITLDYSLEGMRSLGYDAFVPGESELRLGKELEEALARHKGLRVVAANVLRPDGKHAFDPWFVKTLSDGRRVAVVGVVEPFDAPPAPWRVTSAEDAAAAAVADLRGKADVVVIAASMREDAARRLSAKVPEAALVAAGWATEGADELVSTGGAPMALLGEFGWYVTRVDFDQRLRAVDARRAWLDEAVPDDPAAAGLVARFKAEMSSDGEFSARLVDSMRKQNFVGSESCASCHPTEFATWRGSHHAHAMRTLVDKKSERDMRCVACHLVDVPPPMADPAAESATYETLGVGCETCHGGGARHALLARQGSVEESRRALAPATRDACLRCHFPPNDTHFEFDKKWPKIAHGKKAAATSQTR